ncbi:hypothetical protein CU037_2647 [Enterococcus faecium]|uniref:hypothetical protein n=1 Tax=Lactococcus lactis TaxID=1358 RepID=UPI001DA5D6B9|nr:hypothetical protein [Enterococcus faecium]MBK4849439.1 hypothetical protein [Enterococcus faecium]MBK4860138.1 hypothetical protein [Enterococcus faecium]
MKKSDVLPLGKIPCGRGYFDFFDRVKYLSLPSNGKIARMADSNTPLAITSSSSKSS